MYTSYMNDTDSLSVTDARQNLASIIERVRSRHDPVYLTLRGTRIAAIINSDDLDRIVELAEDMADVLAAEEARAEMKATGDEPIPWEQVKADLGLI
jgi:prevent-host-death family protein